MRGVSLCYVTGRVYCNKLRFWTISSATDIRRTAENITNTQVNRKVSYLKQIAGQHS